MQRRNVLLCALLTPIALIGIVFLAARLVAKREDRSVVASMEKHGLLLSDQAILDWINSVADVPEYRSVDSVVAIDLTGAHLQDRDFENIGRLHNVRNLNLTRCRGITYSRLAHLANLRTLVVLNLRGTEMNDRALEQVAALQHLEILILAETAVSDAGLRHIRTLTTIRHLDLSRTRVGALSNVSALLQLEELNLSRTSVGDDDLSAIDGHSQLRDLNLTGTLVGDQAMRFIAGLPALQVLQLSGTAVTDAGLAALAEGAQLQTLALDNTSVTDRGVTDLVSHKQLYFLDVQGTKMTAEGVMVTRQLQPSLRLRHDFESINIMH